MEKQFICYRRDENAVLHLSSCSAKDLLLKHLNRNGINYYCTDDGIQRYYRLRNTGLRIQQSIYKTGHQSRLGRGKVAGASKGAALLDATIDDRNQEGRSFGNKP